MVEFHVSRKRLLAPLMFPEQLMQNYILLLLCSRLGLSSHEHIISVIHQKRRHSISTHALIFNLCIKRNLNPISRSNRA